MKKLLLLVLAMAALLSACITGGMAPPKQDPCPEGQYMSSTSQTCVEYPKSI